MRRTFLLLAVVAVIGVPAGALAAKPSHSATPASTNAKKPAKPPKVTYVLRGSLSSYTAANGSTNGSISLTVKSSNFAKPALKGITLTFAVDSKTKVVLHDGKAIADGDRGVVKVRAQKKSSAATLQVGIASEVVDQGAQT